MPSISLRALVLVLVCVSAGAAMRAQMLGQVRGTLVDDDGRALKS